MSASNFLPLEVPPGVVLSRSGEGAAGRWSFTQNVRFLNGKPEKRKGFTQLNSTLLAGVARGFAAWNNPSTGAPLYAVGTEQRLYGSTDGVEPTDITPLEFNLSLDDDVSTVSGSGKISIQGLRKTVTIPFSQVTFISTAGLSTVAISPNYLLAGSPSPILGTFDIQVGDVINIPTTVNFGGLALLGNYTITAVLLAPSGGYWMYQFTAGGTASSSSTTSGSVRAKMGWATLGSAPTLATTTDSDLVTISATAHGLTAGQRVRFPGPTSVGGLTITGLYTVQSTTTNAFVIRAGSWATSTASGVNVNGTIVYSTTTPGTIIRLFQSAGETLGGLTLTGDWVVIDSESETVVDLVPSGTEFSFTSTPVATVGGRTVTLTTTNGSPTVTVNDTSTPVAIGDKVRIPSTTVGGITVRGEYTVVTKSTNSFTITHTSNATSGATSGSVSMVYDNATSRTVTITWAGHGMLAGDKFAVIGATVLNGIMLRGEYTVATASTNSFTIVLDSPRFATGTGSGGNASSTMKGYRETMLATSTETLAGGVIPFERRLSNPFGTTSGQATVTVTDIGHGRAVGNLVVFSGASAVAGLTLNGTFAIQTVPSADTYTITAPGNANATTTGGGNVWAEYILPAGDVDADPGVSDPASWSISPVGEDAVMNRSGGSVYYWDSSSGNRAGILSGAPTALFVCMTDERFLHALGINGEPLTFGWADRDNPNDWISTATNLANEGRKVQAGSKLVAMTPAGNGLNLIWTDIACYTHQFTGSQFIYDTRVATNGGENAGLIGPHAFARTPRGVFWMSQSSFKAFAGAVVDIPNCEDVRSYVFEHLNTDQQAKCHAVYDHINNSIDFYYVPIGQTEPTECVTVNLTDYSWCPHTETRTTGATFNQAPQKPYKITTDGRIMGHETGLDANGVSNPSSIALAPLEIFKGKWCECNGFDPDFKRMTGNIDITISTYDRYPGSAVDTETETCATTDQIVDFRTSGRHMSLLLEQDVLGGDWALDLPQIDVAPSGGRR